jgi:methionine-rich copper-binding protein CopC
MKRYARILTLVLAATALAATPAVRRHFALARSVPAAGTTVPSPRVIQLWFTEAPEEGSLTVRLLDARGELVETGSPVKHVDDAKAFDVTVGHTLPNGAYSVAFRGIGDDGHTVQNEFAFTVDAAARSNDSVR